jgi:myo-inositol 2-dehydrogenase/D-chiro-inositol 1-dehydrogenase
MIRFALLGAGRIGQIHARNVAAHGNARLIAVHDVDSSAADRVVAQWGCEVRAADNIFDAADVDAVIIATSAETHAGFIEEACRARKAIFCEKPIDKDVIRVVKCLNAVRSSSVPLFMAFNRRFDPNFVALRQRLFSGEIGRAEMIFLTSRDPAAPSLSYIAGSGGLYRDMMIHDFDVARWLLGVEPVRVFAVGSCFADPGIATMGLVDTAVVTMTTETGVIANINCAMRATYGYDQRVEVHGSLGMLQMCNQFQTTLVKSDGEGIGRELPLSFFAERYAQAYVNELDYFIGCLEAGIPPKPDGEDGLQALILAEAAHRSREAGHPVNVADVDLGV